MLSISFAISCYVVAQTQTTAPEKKFTPPPTVAPDKSVNKAAKDSFDLPYGVQDKLSDSYNNLQFVQPPTDLKTPSNITTTAEFDPETGHYVVRTKVGDNDIVTPFLLSPDEYNDIALRQSMQEYYRQKNTETIEKKKNQPFNFLDMQFGLGPLESVFGPGGVQLKTTGSLNINMGVKSNKTDNPALSVAARRKTYFDFDQKIQATIAASVGDKMKFNMSYNTDATFDFDNKNLKLAYEGKEDEIIKNLEAGNVSMTTGSSLIRGSAALFGIKTKLQFGKLTATALISQQNSQTQTVNTKGGAQTTSFYITADNYDQNRNFFLSHFFRDNYDQWCSKLPLVSSGINITRVEVWVTNKRGNFNESRNIVAFADLGENSHLCNSHWSTGGGDVNPSNNSNNELAEIKNNYPDARDISQTSSALKPLEAYGIEGGKDYEKIEQARLLSSSEYSVNSSLGYITLSSALNPDEVLAVAFQYTYRGKTYQVGEFSADIDNTSNSLYVKMLKGTTTSPQLPIWHLMMKNVYSLGAYQIQSTNFKFDVKYLSDTTGTELNYIPEGNINGKPLLQVMNLDRLDANKEPNVDGRFDFLEGYTVVASKGRVIFPVVEPFGSHLKKAMGGGAIADKYVYQELYDCTLPVARQYSDKNKYVMTGEYQASAGNVIRLNAMNVPRGSVVVTAGGVTLTENSDYTVDYNMGTVTITNQSIIDAGTNISVSMENQSTFSMQRKTLMGLDLDYAFNKDFHVGATLMHYGEKALTEKVSIGDELVNNTIWGANVSYKTNFMWLTNLLNKIPTVNATAPSSFNFKGEFAQLIPHQAKTGSNAGSSYIDDFESTQSGIDLRSPYSWFLASTPYDPSASALFPEAGLSNNIDYGKNRALLSWYHIDRLFTQRNSSLVPGYIKNDVAQLSNPYVREIPYSEVFPGRELNYGESSIIQTLNLSFYPQERGPYNLDAQNLDPSGNLLYPEKRWGGIMRKLDNTNFEQSNIEYIQFWMLDPFLDQNADNREGGDLYFNLGEMSEDILKDGLKSYENGLPVDGDTTYIKKTVWGKVSTQSSMTYAFDTSSGSRIHQDVGLNGLSTTEEKEYSTYRDYVQSLRKLLPDSTIVKMEEDQFSPINDPGGDNYHFYRGYDYDQAKLGILDRYKRYNGTEGNSLSPSDASDPLYQSARSVPDVEDINQDNTLNEYERYFQYKVSIRPEDLVVGKNFITDKQTSTVYTRDGKEQTVDWYQFRIPLSQYEKKIGSINDFSTIRFARMFMTGFKEVTHLRFATLELVRGEWRNYDFNLNNRGDAPAEGQLDVSVVNIEENADREPVNYVLPPGVTRIVDPGQSQVTQLNEQSLSLKVTDLKAGDGRGIYRDTQQDLRNYKRLQMWVHAESLIDDVSNLRSGELSMFIRLGSDVKANYYEYEIPLVLTPHGRYNNWLESDRQKVWPLQNFMDIRLSSLVDLKKERNRAKDEGSGIGYASVYTGRDPENERNTMAVKGNPSLSDVRVILVGVRNNSNIVKNGIVWVNELKVTDFDESGGWAAKANVNLGISDVATVNVGAHVETAGFGSVDQSLNERRMDDYHQYNFAVQADLGRFLPEKAKLKAPIYYSYSTEKTTPKYNPLDKDVLLKDALDDAVDKHARDSISAYAEERSTIKSFSISGLKFDITSKHPMPWDPSNFTFNFSFNKQSKNDPTTEYENTNDYRGSLAYNYSPMVKGLKPFSWIKSKNKNLKFIKEWEFNYLPNTFSFLTNMSRYYYEMQTRSELDDSFQLPVSVSKNFLWDRQLQVTWNLTKSIQLSFNSNTSARIEETAGAVNRKLFPDEYKQWKDTVWSSILSLGTPWAYNQSFVATYRAPFNRIPVLDFLTGNFSYNSTYRWDRGAEIDGEQTGNKIASQSSMSVDGRINFESLWKKIPYLKDIDKRFNNVGKPKTQRKPRKFERTYKLRTDTTTTIVHNMRTRKVKVLAENPSTHEPFVFKYKVLDNNKIEILTPHDGSIKFTINEVVKEDRSIWRDMGEYALRFMMSPRSASVRWKKTTTMSLPLFRNNIGDIFGQSTGYGAMSPGLGFAFGFEDESYIYKAKERGWLITDDGQTSPAMVSHANELNIELNLEFIKGLKLQLTMNRTDNRSKQIQFMYADMPVTYSGSYTKTHCAIGTAFGSSSAEDGYFSKHFQKMLDNIPVIADRYNSLYNGTTYPRGGFMDGNPLGGQPFNPENGTVLPTSSDVLVPAFLSAYTGTDPKKQYLDPFPSFAQVLPNWRLTYDGLINIGNLKSIFKSFQLSHAYQCTYSVGSYSSYLNWLPVSGSPDRGYVLDTNTEMPVPSSPYNISTVAITERFAPLFGVTGTLKNELQFNIDWKNQRTLTLNTSAGQVVEATSSGLTVGCGYKIIGFNSVLKMRGSQSGVSNDLTLKADFSLQNTQALIRRIETNYTQATSGTRTMTINFNAQYILSRKLTLGAFFDHQVNTPLVSNAAYPTTNSSYGISLNLNLTR